MSKLEKYINQFLVFIVLLFITSNTSAAGSKKILLSEEAEWPPYTYEKSGTPTKGLSLMLMTEIFSRINIEIDLKLFPQNRCIEQMKDGTRDAMTLISINKDREEFIEFSEPLLESKGLIYYSNTRKTPFRWNIFYDLKDYTIGIVSGYNYGDTFKKVRYKYPLKTYEVTNIEQNFEKLIAGRIDIMLANQAEANEFIRLNPAYYGKLKAADKPYLSYYYHIGFSKKSWARVLLPKINKVIKQIKTDGTFNKIVANYLL